LIMSGFLKLKAESLKPKTSMEVWKYESKLTINN